MRVADRSERPEAPAREFAVVHEDDAIVCIDKPAGVAVHGGSGESFGVIEQMRRARPGEFLELVHRLDKETSGLLLRRQDAAGAGQAAERPALARSPAGRSARPTRRSSSAPGPTSLQGDRRRPAQGHRSPTAAATSGPSTRTTSAAGARSAWFAWRSASPTSACSTSTLKTGRTHQIRVHLADAGHAIAGDPKYGDFALNRALARGQRGRVAALRPDVPARPAPAFRASGERRADRARSAAAGGLRSPARGARAARAERLAPTSPPGVVRLRRAGRQRFNADWSSPVRPELGCSHGDANPQRNPHHEDQAPRHRFGRRPRRSAASPAARPRPRPRAAAIRSPSGTASTPTSTAPCRASMPRIRPRAR